MSSKEAIKLETLFLGIVGMNNVRIFGIRNDFKKKTANLVTLSKKGGRGQEKGKI